MKRAVAAIAAVVLATAASSAVYADDQAGGGSQNTAGQNPAGNTDACGAFMCLAGLITGGGGGDGCSGYVSKYFSIVQFHRGHFAPGETASARGGFMNQCSGADPVLKQAISSRYGAQQFGP
ncbi:killer protein [Burkholderia latens]|uniref:killer protein n=1 Tax=Burkholderia latens TaxID=488446 RepID=UPI0039A63F69